MINIIDYGRGNLHSVQKALERLGAEVRVSSKPEDILSAAKVILPGVGAFGDCMGNLERYGLVPAIRETAAAGKPLLGICLGLQMLFEGSEEDPGVPGLGIFPGQVKLIEAPGLKIPHMGWNSLTWRQESILFRGLPMGSFVYFVHSYHAVPEDASLVTAVTEYGGAVTAAVGQGNVQAVQFHPEKSGTVGLQILKNFKEWQP